MHKRAALADNWVISDIDRLVQKATLSAEVDSETGNEDPEIKEKYWFQ